MSDIETGGPAFPHVAEIGGQTPDGYIIKQITDGGMTLRQYAAIKLRVPKSGTDWLDAMILESRKDEIAESAMHALIEQRTHFPSLQNDYLIAARANGIAEAMIDELKNNEQTKN